MSDYNNIRHELSRLWTESYGTRALTLSVALAGCMNVCASLLFIWATKRIVDCAIAPAHTIPWQSIALLVGCMVLQLIIPATRRRLEAVALARYTNNMRRRLLLHLLQSQWSGRTGMHHGDALNRMRDDVSTLAALSCSTIPGIMSVFLRLAGAFAFLAILDLRLAAAVIFIMPIALVISKMYVKKTRRLTRRIREQDSELQTFLQESLHHRTLFSTLMGTERRADSFNTMQLSFTDKILHRTDISIFSNAVISFGFMAGYTITFLWSAYGLAAGIVSFGMMTAFLQLVSQVQRPVIELSQRIPAFISASVALDRIDEILATPQEDYTSCHINTGVPTGLRFKDASYRYPDGDSSVIHKLNHDFTPGSVTGIIGPTGSGKSTLLRLMLGLVRPTSGIAEFYTPGSSPQPIGAALRHNIVYVPQGNSLVCGTVRDNLLLANPHATESEMREALTAAVADFVFELPQGLDTECFEGGGGFSEGQAQRIAIARGLLKHGSLILLDEPTSSLDPATEQLFLKRFISRVTPGATVIIVTHRPALLSFCTSVINMT